MSEIKALLSRALPDEAPVSSISRDTAIAAGRRARQRRRVTRGVAGVLAAATGLAVGTVAVAGVRPDTAARPGTSPLVIPSVTSTSAGGCPSGEYLARGGVCLPKTVADPAEPAERGAPRLTAALGNALGSARPDAALTADPMMPGRPPLAFAGITGHYKAGAFVTVGSRTGRINVAVTTGTSMAPGGRTAFHKDEFDKSAMPSPQPVLQAADDPCTVQTVPSSQRLDCRNLAGPNGESVNVYTARGDNGDVSYQVDLYRHDGTRVVLWVSNSRDARDTTFSDQPPLTADQALQLALTPGLTLYP